jgi:hypothetical protein
MDIAGVVLGYIAVIGGLSIAPLAIWITQKNERRRRELEHIERLKALEFGRTLPQDEPWLSPQKIALVIGGVVPLGAFICVGITTFSVGYHEEMWLAACLVGVTSAIGGSILGGLALTRRKTTAGLDTVKPYVEEDAYDVVSARG